MKEIDTRHWTPFPMTEVFEMKNTKSITAILLVPDSGTIPYVTSQEGDNGVQMYVDCPEEWLDEGGCIMIGGKTLTFSYQKQDFCSNDSHNIALYSRDASSKSENCQLFLISALRASLEQIYSWGDSISMKRIKDDSVMLPGTRTGGPDWVYMEQTMREVKAKQEQELDALSSFAKSVTKGVSNQTWGEFSINDLFDVVKGTRLTKSHMRPGAIRHIGASQFDNGVTAMISNDEAVHPGNLITVCYDGPVGTTFYQPEEFWATDAVNVLYPRFDLNETIGLFLAPVIQEAGSAFDYGQKWGAELMRSTSLRLPVTAGGDPDWDYMEQTMRGVMAEREAALDSLQALAGV